MNARWPILLSLAVPILLGSALRADGPVRAQKPALTWKRTVLDTAFRSEGVAAADVNKDGKTDVIAGECWYENLGGGKWKRHVLRSERTFDPKVYSQSFACFVDDFSGDGYPDVIVIPFPGEPCYWYENPGAPGGKWKGHLLTTSACNETPIYVDLFKSGKRRLVMGWNPERFDKGKKVGNYDDRGEMCYFVPGQDVRQPWQRISISGPSKPGKYTVPGTHRFSHGLGAGDVNGDGRIDVICTGGWWEQPAKATELPWKFHPANLGEACADMVVTDMDGDGKADIVSSSAHNYGFWWHQQRAGKNGSTFVRRDLIPTPSSLARAAGEKLGKSERAVYVEMIKLRDGYYRKAALAANAELTRMAHDHAERLARSGAKEVNIAGKYPGKIVNVLTVKEEGGPVVVAKYLMAQLDKAGVEPGSEIGLGYAKSEGGMGQYTLIVGDRGRHALPSATHALHYVDLDGDGVKDLVTGRRYWAHAPHGPNTGDGGVNDPAYLYWYKGKRDSKGGLSFTPNLIDDASGIGTQFAIADVNGDGILDVIISNKRGVFVFEQVRAVATDAVPTRRQ